MAEISGFHNSRNGDRRVKADFFARFFGSLIGNGVFPNPSTGCQVISNNDMTVTVKAGKAWINGVFYENTADLTLSLDVADGVLKRIDRVVLQFNTIDRTIAAKVKKGTFASSPVAPSLQRDADAYELGIADIFVGNGVVSVSQSSITDLRLNSNYCGVVAALINQVDTTTLFNQYQAWYLETTNQAAEDLSTILSAFQSSFNAWFADLQDILDENTAGNLLNMINNLIVRMTAAETAISNLQKFQTAGGTGTAITLTGIELVDGFQTTFVISASNSGAATTINTKPLYKPGTTTVPKLIAGKAATVWYNSTGDCFFIKASSEGTAIAGEVLAGVTFSNDDDTGLTGTLDLTNLTSENVKKNIDINGVTGALPYLPPDYIGEYLYLKKDMGTTQSSSSFTNIVFAETDTCVFYLRSSDFHCFKYNYYSKVLTDLGLVGASSNQLAITISDDGSVIYVKDSTGLIYYWNGSSWVSTGQTGMSLSGYICCNPDGSELYFTTGTNGSTGTALKKWVKSTGNVTTILSIDNILNEYGIMGFVDDGSVWICVNGSPVTYKRIKISDGTILNSISRPYPFTRRVCMFRNALHPYFGSVCGSASGSGGTDAVAVINKDGTFTGTQYANTYGYCRFAASLSGDYQVVAYTSGTTKTFLLKLQDSLSAYATTAFTSESPLSLSADGGRWVSGGSYLHSLLPYI